jgi:tetratricopeptide (TPR) repeat protein
MKTCLLKKIFILSFWWLCVAYATVGQVAGGGGTRTISGQVVVPGGAATNVVVTVEATNRSFHRVVMTDGGGNFVFSGVPVGQHYITIEAPGYITLREMLDVPPGTGVLVVQYLLRPIPAARNNSSEPNVSVSTLQIPPKALAEFRKGIDELRSGNLKRAREYLQKALKLHREFPQALLALATIELLEEKTTPALELLQEAIRIDSNYGEGYLMLSRVLNSLGRYAEAIEAAAKSVPLLSNPSQAHFEQGVAAVALGDLAQGADSLAKLERTAGGDAPETRLLRAALYLKMGKLSEAKFELETFLAAFPDHSRAPLARHTLEQLKEAAASPPR